MKFPMKYGSHLPVLIKLIGITDGPILEMGIGMCSTPFLHWSCWQKKRFLLSLESDKAYYDMFSPSRTDYHSFVFVEDWDKVDIERPWDIALIDHAPSERRKIDIARLAPYTKYIVVHDTYWKQEKHYHYQDIYPLFEYRFDYQPVPYQPYTTVLSNLVDLKGIGFTV